MLGEFNLIETYFSNQQANRDDVVLAQGDDCALVSPPSGCHIAISTDTLVCGTHFLASASPEDIAHKALASNLSDLAAMGATPAWVSMGISMPEVNEPWLASFCQAFFELANQHNIQLIGGDTTKGPLTITLTVQGFVPVGQALTRGQAQEGDGIYVTGTLGDAKAGLDVILKTRLSTQHDINQILEKRHYRSTPQVLAGTQLRGLASAAIDISDGLIADLRHILSRSQRGAIIDTEQLPISNELLCFTGSDMLARQYALTSGEEYQLCFTVPQHDEPKLDQQLAGIPYSRIGQITNSGRIVLHEQGCEVDWELTGYDHFKDH